MLAHVLLLLLAAVQSQPATPPRDAASPKSGSASLSGLITEQGSNRPLHRAVVTLVPAAGQGLREALTDAEGRYEFVGLEPGEYGVVATAGDLRATHLRQAFGRPTPLEPDSRLPRSGVELKADERRTGVDVSLTRALAIEGRVIDPWDQPMSEVGIQLTRADGTDYPNFGISDDRGDYRVFGLTPGRYRVCADSQGSADVPSDTSRSVRTCHPAAVGGDGAEIILTTSDASGIDVHVQRQRTFTASGTVVDATGTIVDVAHVMAEPLDRVSGSASNSGIGGMFVLRGLTPGRYLLRATVGGSENPDDSRPPLRELELGYASIDVLATDVVGTVIQLSKGRTAKGRVRFEGGSPVPATQLRMAVHTRGNAALGPSHRGNPYVAAVGDMLDFELKAIYQLPLTIDVTGLPDGWAIKSVRFNGQDITGVPTNLGIEVRPGYLEIIATNHVATPAVRVTAEGGDRLSPYHVVLFSTNQEKWKVPPATIAAPESGADVVKLGSILPGEYFVAVVARSDYRLVTNDVSRLPDLASVAARVTFVEGDTRTLDLPITRLPAARAR